MSVKGHRNVIDSLVPGAVSHSTKVVFFALTQFLVMATCSAICRTVQ
jgi:hypothetical protein